MVLSRVRSSCKSAGLKSAKQTRGTSNEPEKCAAQLADQAKQTKDGDHGTEGNSDPQRQFGGENEIKVFHGLLSKPLK